MLISISNNDDYRHVAYVLENRNVGTFVMASAFNKIAKDNRLKTLAELGGSRTNDRDDANTKAIREKQESRFLFGSKSLYGMYINRKVLGEQFKSMDYGDVCLVWKTGAKEKSVAFLGDSVLSHRVVGTPALNLGVVTGSRIKDWLAQYKVYAHGRTSYMDYEEGFKEVDVKLYNFDVDLNSMRTVIGKGLNMIEVTHNGPLHFPQDIQTIVVKNPDWVKPVANLIRINKYQCNVCTADKYEDGMDV